MENTISQVDKLIDGSSVDLSINSKPILTPKTIGEQIVLGLDKDIEDAQNDDKLRLIKFKRHLLNYLFRRIATRDIDENNRLKDIEPLEEDDNLILYSFFLSQNPNFHFEWSYLLNKIVRLEEFLRTFREHIKFVCKDITELIKRLPVIDNVQFIVDNYLIITFFYKANSIDSKIDLDYMNRLLLSKSNSYKIEIRYKYQHLISLSRYSSIKVDRIIDKIETAMSYIVTDESNESMTSDVPNEK